MDGQHVAHNREKEIKTVSGWPMLAAVIVIFAAVLAHRGGAGGKTILGIVLGSVALLILGIILSIGFFALEPNETRVAVLFGQYKGTVRGALRGVRGTPRCEHRHAVHVKGF
jgi:hypothetical protein